MLNSIKRHLRTSLNTAGIEVRIASRMTGVDPLHDIKSLHGGKEFHTVIDIGANVGQSALRFHKAFPESSIHSFEPVTATYKTGLANTAHCPEISFHHLAVGNTSERIVFYTSGTSQMNTITNTEISSVAGEGERNEVEVVRMDDFSAAHQLGHIDLFKTDTEGLDLAVLQGAEAILAGRKATFVLCEVGFCRADTTHSFFPPIADYLEKFGYRLVGFYGISNVDHFGKWGVTYADALFAIPD
ncbi:MAG: FkbM family methyltransferase [Luteolibacter sp.]